MEPMGSDFDLASVTINIQGNELLNSRRRWFFTAFWPRSYIETAIIVGLLRF